MQYHAFICHASENKEEFVRPLAESLSNKGLKIWYDEFTLDIGDNLRKSIDLGLVCSRFGIVILSPEFLEKDWPQYELDGLYAREIDGVKTILPIWLNLSKEKLLENSPSLVHRVAFKFPEMNLSVITERLSKIILNQELKEILLKMDDEGKAQLLFVEDWVSGKFHVDKTPFKYKYFSIDYLDSKGEKREYTIEHWEENEQKFWLGKVRYIYGLGSENKYVRPEILEALGRLSETERKELFGSIQVLCCGEHMSMK